MAAAYRQWRQSVISIENITGMASKKNKREI